MNAGTSMCAADAGPLAGSQPSWSSRIAAFGVSLLPVALGGCLLLSWLAGLAIPLWKHARPEALSSWGWAIAYLAFFALSAWALGKTERGSDHRVVAGLIGLFALFRVALVLGFPNLPLNTDQALFHFFVRELGDKGIAPETLSPLSAIYDYPLWTGRGFPVHYWVRRAWGEGDLLWIRGLNVAVASCLPLVVYALACRLLPKGRRKWAVFLLLALPFQSFIVTDYSHHLFSSFYLLLFAWCVWETAFGGHGAAARIGLSIVSGGCLLLMTWQRGVHFIALGVAGGMLLWGAARRIGWRRWLSLLAFAAVVPASIAAGLSARLFDGQLRASDAHRLSSVLPGFVARGWCPESGGEYCGRYEQLDRATPWPRKPSAMYRLALSQIRHAPAKACFLLPLAKTAKLHLVGYAANLEESLATAKSGHLAWVRGFRLAGAPVFLGLAAGGCFLLARRRSPMDRWLPVLLVPMLTWGAYVFAGETSPRYSVFSQPFLALLGALALGGIADKGSGEEAAELRSRRSVAGRAAACAAVLGMGLAAAALAVRALPARTFYADLEKGWLDPATVAPGPYRPFEARIQTGGAMPLAWRLPVPAAPGDVVSFYLLGATGGAGNAELAIGTQAEELRRLGLADCAFPCYIEVEPGRPMDRLDFALRSSGPSASGELAIGYVSILKRTAK